MLISDKLLKEVCKISQKECCRYLICGAEGFVCAKLTPMKTILDIRVANNDMRAQGDNCKGI